MQFPNPYFIDADLNLDGAERRLRLANPKLEYRYDLVTLDENGKSVDEDRRFTRLVTHLEIAERDPWVKTIIADSLTNITQFLIWQVQALNKKEVMEIRDWGQHRSKMLGLLIKRRACNKTFILTCHQYEKTKKKDDKSLEEVLLGYTPAINPGLQEDLGSMFTDIWATRLVATSGGLYKNEITTMPNGMMPFLKNSIGLPATCEGTWAEISKYWPKDPTPNLVVDDKLP